MRQEAATLFFFNFPSFLPRGLKFRGSQLEKDTVPRPYDPEE